MATEGDGGPVSVCGSSAPFQTTSTEDPAYMIQQALSAFIWSSMSGQGIESMIIDRI